MAHYESESIKRLVDAINATKNKPQQSNPQTYPSQANQGDKGKSQGTANVPASLPLLDPKDYKRGS